MEIASESTVARSGLGAGIALMEHNHTNAYCLDGSDQLCQTH